MKEYKNLFTDSIRDELKSFAEYRVAYQEISTLRNILSVLQWDSEITLPEDGREERGSQIGLLSGLIHSKYAGENFYKLAEKARDENEQKTLPGQDERKVEFERLFQDLDRSRRLSQELVEEFSVTTSQAHSVWVKAKKENRFSDFVPILSKIVDLSKQQAECYGYRTETYDALLESYEPGEKAGNLEKLFFNLKNSLKPLVERGKNVVNPFPKEIPIFLQNKLGETLPGILGLSPKISRLDASEHPFSTSLGSKDKRITTRYDLKDPLSSIFSILHETGHALYEVGISEIEGGPSPLHDSVSLGIHESQSRLWENQVGRSREFWEMYYPILLEILNIKEFELGFSKLFSYINQSSPSLIRVEADQITYNLHIILRFEIERDLINGKIQVVDLPEIWNSKMKEMLGINVPSDKQGVLQDVHWSGGAFGYFPTYALGNIYSAQLFQTFLKQNPNFQTEVKEKKDFSSLLNWLKKNVHSKGKFYSANDLIRSATGSDPDSSHLVQYLEKKLIELESINHG
ncbi:carboxypeptidase M32 [Leptospira alstonii]|uniref:Metal-dependent carboxypeptidase n=2 Tax=Leptospira alstonii TaxID=28452 RepID=M6D9Z6_9LEPT|nr:carboxypeptidase M32 [Leptospira alstonii]EMJ98098.1 carboxypeptidase Taq M32 metallopeptidase [Leptospira alstonii serovar Sichuan str. 79601]EQA80986.1 carboxypeptidase Taq M32 metallopeptidase [Leptospira alstonii serovar Pingchang str. 80-412]